MRYELTVPWWIVRLDDRRVVGAAADMKAAELALELCRQRGWQAEIVPNPRAVAAVLGVNGVTKVCPDRCDPRAVYVDDERANYCEYCGKPLVVLEDEDPGAGVVVS